LPLATVVPIMTETLYLSGTELEEPLTSSPSAGEDSHGTAPLGWEFQGCRLVGMTGLLAVPSSRYSYPCLGMGFRVTVFARESTASGPKGIPSGVAWPESPILSV